MIEQVPVVEARLVGFCTSLDAGLLQRCAVQEQAWLDPDGGYREVERRRRDRDVRFTQRPDGSCAGSFQGTVELGEFLQVTFDALLDALKAAVGSGSLPTTGGVLATVVLTMTEESYRDGTGFATTGHNAQVPVREAMSWAGGDYRLMGTVLNEVKEVTAYSTTHRLFTRRTTTGDASLAARATTSSDHRGQRDDSRKVTGRRSSYHHREFERLGWTVHMDAGRPVWIPPRTTDPDQKPIRV